MSRAPIILESDSDSDEETVNSAQLFCSSTRELADKTKKAADAAKRAEHAATAFLEVKMAKEAIKRAVHNAKQSALAGIPATNGDEVTQPVAISPVIEKLEQELEVSVAHLQKSAQKLKKIRKHSLEKAAKKVKKLYAPEWLLRKPDYYEHRHEALERMYVQPNGESSAATGTSNIQPAPIIADPPSIANSTGEFNAFMFLDALGDLSPPESNAATSSASNNPQTWNPSIWSTPLEEGPSTSSGNQRNTP